MRSVVSADSGLAWGLSIVGLVISIRLLLVGFNPGLLDWAMGHLDAGAKRAGRRAEDLQVAWAVRTSIGATTEGARRQGGRLAVISSREARSMGSISGVLCGAECISRLYEYISGVSRYDHLELQQNLHLS